MAAILARPRARSHVEQRRRLARNTCTYARSDLRRTKVSGGFDYRTHSGGRRRAGEQSASPMMQRHNGWLATFPPRQPAQLHSFATNGQLAFKQIFGAPTGDRNT